ncbi:MAG: hypothetical protein ACI4V4_00530 [Eubacterium sp.]
METLRIVLSVLSIVIVITLLVLCVKLFSLVKSNEDKTVEEIAYKINKITTALAIVSIIESALLIVNIIIR